MKSEVEVAVEDRRRVVSEEPSATVPQPEEDPEVEVSADEEEVAGEEADDEGEVEEDDQVADGGDDEVATLSKLKAGLAVWARRRDALQAALQKSEDAEGHLVAAIDGLKAKLVDEPHGAETLPGLVVKLEARRVTTAALRDKFTEVEAKRAPIAAEVQRIETEIEREKQRKASAKLREEAADCLDEFAEGVANLTAPLLRRQEIWAKIRAEYPLAAAMPALKFEHLVHRLDEAMGRPGPVATRFYLLRLLNGALSGSSVAFLDPVRARQLGIDVQ